MSPRSARIARGSLGARPQSHLRVSGSTIPHINNPSPLATTSPPFASLKLSPHLQPPLETTRCQGNEGGGHNTVCVVSIQMIFKLFHLESYLGSSEETRSPNARSENMRGRTRHLASLGTQARTSPTRRAHGRPGDQLSSAFWGPGPRRRRWPGEGRTRLGPVQCYQAPVSYLLPAPSTTAILR